MARKNEVSVRYTQEEISKVKRKAKVLGPPLSSFIRLISLNREVTIK